MRVMKPDDFFQSLTRKEKEAYAVRAGTTLRNAYAYFAPSGIRKSPRHQLIVGFAMASDGNVSLDDSIEYFLIQPVKKLAAEREKESFPDRPSLSEKDGTAKKGREIKDFEVTEESARVGL